MDIYKDQIETVRREQMTLLKIYRNELARCPSGNLGTGKDHGKVRIYHRYKEGDRYRKRAITNDTGLIRSLARKAYLTSMTSLLDSNIKNLDRVLLLLHDLSPKEVMTTLPKEYRVLDHRNFLTRLSMDRAFSCDNTDEHDFADLELESSLFLDASEEATRDRIERHREWGRSPFRQSSYKPEERNLPTSGGIFVRSKSELVIAEKLHTYDIPFHYEEVIPIGRYEYSADFTFECKGNELLYWEHAGMMDDSYYADKHMKKLQMYHSIGIDLGKNLITTYDVDGRVDVNMIDSVIRHQIITRL